MLPPNPALVARVRNASVHEIRCDLESALASGRFPGTAHSPEREWVAEVYDQCFRHLGRSGEGTFRHATVELLAETLPSAPEGELVAVLELVAAVQATDAIPYIVQLVERLVDPGIRAEPPDTLLDHVLATLHAFVPHPVAVGAFETLYFGDQISRWFAVPLFMGLVETRPDRFAEYFSRLLRLLRLEATPSVPGRAMPSITMHAVAVHEMVRLATLRRVVHAARALASEDVEDLVYLLRRDARPIVDVATNEDRVLVWLHGSTDRVELDERTERILLAREPQLRPHVGCAVSLDELLRLAEASAASRDD